MCEEWRTDPGAFYAWAVANGYQEGLQIDRIDNEKWYEPSNCRWVTREEQQHNRVNNNNRMVDGKPMTASAFARLIGIPKLHHGYKWNGKMRQLALEYSTKNVLTMPVREDESVRDDDCAA